MNRIETLLRQMTLTEKLGQLTMTASSYAVTGPVIAGDSTASIKDGSLGNLLNMVGADHVHEMQRLAMEHSRLRIPLLIGLDIIHGHRSLFPIPLAEAGLFDPETWERTAREAAREASADGLAMTFAPMLDVSRDIRWGRTAEGSGEDPYVAQCMARAKVRGFQTPDLSAADAIAACAKHFCAYGPVAGGREYAPVDISERSLHEVHLPPFAAALEAGVATVMPAFTDLNGVPMTAHIPLLRDWLRRTHGFEGVIVSDYNAIGELIKHGVAADLADAAALALNAGVDIDMMADAYRKGLPVALQRGTVTLAQIDTAVRRVLRLKEQLGLFDDPYRRGRVPESDQAVAERRQLARQVGARAVTLLKNANDTLPLSPRVRRLALLGPLADAAEEMRGCWWAAGVAENHVGVLEGLRRECPQLEVRHAAGVGIDDPDLGAMDAALALIDGSDALVLCLGERATMSGEAASRAYPELPAVQRRFAEAAIAAARAREIPVVVVLFSGRPLVIPWLAEQADALLAAWFLGCEAGAAIADVLSGRTAPAGRTPMSWPRAVGQIPVFFGQRPTGRPMNPADYFTSKYLDVPNDPLFPFGHGLSYSSITYGVPQLRAPVARQGDVIALSIEVRNEGRRAAEDTLFVFSRDRVASVTQPLMALRCFAKVHLDAGTSTQITLEFPASELVLLDASLRPAFEPGEVELCVGPSADPARLQRVVIQLVPTPYHTSAVQQRTNSRGAGMLSPSSTGGTQMAAAKKATKKAAPKAAKAAKKAVKKPAAKKVAKKVAKKAVAKKAVKKVAKKATKARR